MFSVTVIIAIIILAVLVLRRFHPVAASVLSMLLVIGIAGWGGWTYHQGGAISIMNYALSPTVFFLMVVIWFGLEVLSLLQAFQKRDA